MPTIAHYVTLPYLKTLSRDIVYPGESGNKIGAESPTTSLNTQPFTSCTTAPTNIPTGTHTHQEPYTHPETIARNARRHHRKTALLAARVPNYTVREMSMRDLFSIPIIGALCLSGCALCFVATAFDVVFVLFCFTPIDSGGLSFDVGFPDLLADSTKRAHQSTGLS